MNFVQRFSFFLILVVFFISPLIGATKTRFTVVIPSYNNIKWCDRNLKSIFSQDYDNFRILYINDCSKDKTGLAVRQFVAKNTHDYQVIDFDDAGYSSIDEALNAFSGVVNAQRYFVTIVNNVNRAGALANLYRSIQSCDDDEVIVTVDGDDWLNHSHVLQELDEAYSKGNVWLTHGSMSEYPHQGTGWSIPIPDDLVKCNEFRKYRCPSHLRTFYAWLFKKIQLEDLLYKGKFFSMAWDMAMMYPMIEMAGEKHAFMSQLSYVYNTANQINDNKVNAELQNELDAYIRNKTPYLPLEN